MFFVTKGAADISTYVQLFDSTTFLPSTGYTIADLDLQYVRNAAAPSSKVDATALATTSTAHTDNRAIEIDATNSPGLYRVDWPDAAFATGVDQVTLVVNGAGLVTHTKTVQLTDEEPFAVAAPVPISATSDPAMPLAGVSDGLTVRDHFALHALLGLLSQKTRTEYVAETLVTEAWDIADELWAQR